MSGRDHQRPPCHEFSFAGRVLEALSVSCDRCKSKCAPDTPFGQPVALGTARRPRCESEQTAPFRHCPPALLWPLAGSLLARGSSNERGRLLDQGPRPRLIGRRRDGPSARSLGRPSSGSNLARAVRHGVAGHSKRPGGANQGALCACSGAVHRALTGEEDFGCDLAGAGSDVARRNRPEPSSNRREGVSTPVVDHADGPG